MRKPIASPGSMVLLLSTLLITVLVSACSSGSESATTNPTQPPQLTATSAPTQTPDRKEVKATVLVKGLNIPWGLVFLPDGKALLTEREGRILKVDASGKVEEVQRIAQEGAGEGGLLGITISPDYQKDHLIYVYYSTAEDNRVVRFQEGKTPQVIFKGIPVGAIHNGGRIAFGPDGMLYIGTGDAGDRSNAQNKESLGGKILRIKPDGSIPSDNPFPSSPVYSYGHRNVQGLAWDEKGQLYATEFGQDTYDEINKIEPGKNYGWPEVEGKGNDSRFVNPLVTFSTAEASPSGATFLKHGAIPQWEGSFFMASLRGERLWRIQFGPDGNTVVQKEALLQGQYGRLRLVTQAPDGSLWILTSNQDGRGNPTSDDDRIIRLGPAA